MHISIFDHYPTAFKAKPSLPTEEGHNMNRIEICQAHVSVTLWLTEGQARELRAALDVLYPPAASTPIAAAAEPAAHDEAESWQRTMEYAEREQPPLQHALPCDGKACLVNTPICGSKHADYGCTLSKGHTGPHSACGGTKHNLHVWSQEQSQRCPEHSMDDPSEPRVGDVTDLAEHLFETATALNRIAAGKEVK